MGGIYQLSSGAAQAPPAWAQPSFSAFPGGQQTSQSFANFVADADTPTASLIFDKVGSWPAWLSLSGSNLVCAVSAQVSTVTGLAISASDGTTTVTSPTFSVQVVKSVNRPPSWTQGIPSIPMNPTAQTPATYDLRTVSSDLDGDVLSYERISILPTGFSLSVSGILTVTNAATAGIQALQFRAWDGGSVGTGAATDSPNITFNVTIQQQPAPQWSGLPTQFSQIRPSSFPISQYCSSSLAITFSISPTSAVNSAQLAALGISMSSNGLFTITSSATIASTIGVVVRATNTTGSTDSPPFTINVVSLVSSSFAFLGPVQLPLDSGTQIQMRSKTTPTLNVRGTFAKQIYILGGDVTQSGSSGSGSQTLFRFDAATNTLAIAFPYNGTGIQPGHPNGVMLVPNIGTDKLEMIPGTTS